jgi:hypothetical protein
MPFLLRLELLMGMMNEIHGWHTLLLYLDFVALNGKMIDDWWILYEVIVT